MKHTKDHDLKAHNVCESADDVANDTETTEFKRNTRLLQALWREKQGLPIGSQPMRPREGNPARPLGSRIELEAARESGANFLTDGVRVMDENTVTALLGTELQQIWIDHLLALSMLQHSSGVWTWAKFILVYPSRNPGFAAVARRYVELLLEPDTFGVSTIEDLLDAEVLPAELTMAFRERYL